jgi:FkbM family methyltransferase
VSDLPESTQDNVNVLVDSRFGPMIVNRYDSYIGKSLVHYGEFSYGEIEILSQLLKPGRFVVEAGANIGAHTLPIARQVGIKGRVIALEPQRCVFQTLCGNMALNSITNVDCLWAAAGSQLGTIQVPEFPINQPNNFGGVSLNTAVPGYRVSLLTIDSLNLPKCHLIKADVEGMELAVLKGAEETIKRCRPVLYVESDREDKRAELFQWIDSKGYAMYWHTPMLFNPLNHRKVAENIFANLASLNVLCVPAEYPQQIEGLTKIAMKHPV